MDLWLILNIFIIQCRPNTNYCIRYEQFITNEINIAETTKDENIKTYELKIINNDKSKKNIYQDTYSYYFMQVAKFPARKFVQFSCKQEEKVLIGSNYSVCVDGHWSHAAPQCAGKTNKYVPIFQDVRVYKIVLENRDVLLLVAFVCLSAQVRERPHFSGRPGLQDRP